MCTTTLDVVGRESIIKQYLENELSNLLKLKESVKVQLKYAPKGCLRCIKSHGIPQYTIDGKYVKKSDIKKAQKIAQRDYNLQVLSYVKERITLITYFLKKYDTSALSDFYSKLHESRKALVTPVITPIDVRIKEFLSENYDPYAFKEDDKTEIFTENGERVRSKSEKMIADKLASMEIPYLYEKPLLLKVKGTPKVFHPDFTIMNKRNGKIVYLEHLGMMDNPEYSTKAIEKIGVYENNGILLGDKLFITKETATYPLSTKRLEDYCRMFFM